MRVNKYCIKRMNAAYRGNGTLAVDGTRFDLGNSATWFNSSVGSPLQLDDAKNVLSIYHFDTQSLCII